MARGQFGGTLNDFVQSAAHGPNLMGATVWANKTGNPQITDLLDMDGDTMTSIGPEALKSGYVQFQGPADGTSTVWLECGASQRIRMVADPTSTYALLPVAASGSDDSTPLAARLPDLKLGVGSFSLPSGLNVPAASIVEGRGMGTVTTAYTAYTEGLTTIHVTGATADGLKFNAAASSAEKLGLVYTGGTPATAGSGLKVAGGDGFRGRDISAKGFYDNFHITGDHYKLEGAHSTDPVRAGLHITGSDSGEGRIVDFMAEAGPINTAVATALLWDGGGGLHVRGFKTNGIRVTGVGKTWARGWDFTNTNANTVEIRGSDSVLDCIAGIGVNLDGTTFQIADAAFNDVHIKDSFSVLTTGWKSRNVNVLSIAGGAMQCGPLSTAGFDIDTCNQLNIQDVMVRGVPADVPVVLLGSNVRSATVKLGNVGPPGVSGAYQWAAGTPTLLLSLAQYQGYQFGGHGSFEFAWKAPAPITSNAVYTNLWKINATGGPLLVEFTLFVYGTSGNPAHVIARQARFIIRPFGGGNSTFTTYGTDTASSIDADIQWAASGSDTTISAKINAGSALTSLTAASVVKITGVPQKLYAYN